MTYSLHAEADCVVEETALFALVARALGENWTTRSSHQLRLGHSPVLSLSHVAFDRHGTLVGTVRLWPIQAGDAGDALLLGPLAVDPSLQGQGIGQALLHRVINAAKQQKTHGAIVLVGDAPYYERVGFSAKPTWLMRMPGRYDQNRLLGYELIDGYLTGKEGVITR